MKDKLSKDRVELALSLERKLLSTLQADNVDIIDEISVLQCETNIAALEVVDFILKHNVCNPRNLCITIGQT